MDIQDVHHKCGYPHVLDFIAYHCFKFLKNLSSISYVFESEDIRLIIQSFAKKLFSYFICVGRKGHVTDFICVVCVIFLHFTIYVYEIEMCICDRAINLHNVINFVLLISSLTETERSLLGDKKWTHPWADEIGVIIGILLIILFSAMMDYIKYSHVAQIHDVIEKIHRIRVIRGGKESILSTAEVVVGDLCLVNVGDVIPADGVLIESYDLKVEDTRISGDVPCMQKGPTDPIVNAGTVVIEGFGRMIVASVGTPLHGHVSTYGNVKGPWSKKYIFQKLIEIDKKKEKLLSYTDVQNKLFRFSTELTYIGL
ncbi:calcium-transporting ATPase PAT1-like [Schistocerca cancellata]|uniref:calcium-transporting ATPase PAT1-like n=1 Tax=Schistocerca cancellata TaxID=274614 RepID=UPI00211740C3|nr:calcium-transporting ATPase PAT1-like [Schistocerca cancellata]